MFQAAIEDLFLARSWEIDLRSIVMITVVLATGLFVVVAYSVAICSAAKTSVSPTESDKKIQGGHDLS